jgi:uncharacterized surface protein with fasciclin (FAS1) repeats
LLLAAALPFATTAVGCSSAGAGPRAGATVTAGAPASALVTGPLCEQLPSGTDPGNPASLARDRADVALQWIPVLTKFEAVVRASGLAADLRDTAGMTILAPTDDAFEKKFSEADFDELILFRRDDLRTLLKSHLVNGALPLAKLVDAGTVTTLAGTSLTISRSADVVRIADRAETVCADYRAANARIHIINAVLGDLPTTADDGEGRSH